MKGRKTTVLLKEGVPRREEADAQSFQRVCYCHDSGCEVEVSA